MSPAKAQDSEKHCGYIKFDKREVREKMCLYISHFSPYIAKSKKYKSLFKSNSLEWKALLKMGHFLGIQFGIFNSAGMRAILDV